MVISFSVIADRPVFRLPRPRRAGRGGEATAQSMAVNLILVTVLNMVMTFIFWGFDPNLPIA